MWKRKPSRQTLSVLDCLGAPRPIGSMDSRLPNVPDSIRIALSDPHPPGRARPAGSRVAGACAGRPPAAPCLPHPARRAEGAGRDCCTVSEEYVAGGAIMSTGHIISRAAILLARRVGGPERDEWIRAMAAEWNERETGKMRWALGCLGAVLLDRLVRERKVAAAIALAAPVMVLCDTLTMNAPRSGFTRSSCRYSGVDGRLSAQPDSRAVRTWLGNALARPNTCAARWRLAFCSPRLRLRRCSSVRRRSTGCE